MRNFSETGYRFTNNNILKFLVEESKKITDKETLLEINYFSKLAKSKVISKKTIKLWIDDVNGLPKEMFESEYQNSVRYIAKRNILNSLNS